MTIERVGVVGGGQMGAGIAEISARAGLEVRVLAYSEPAAERARHRCTASLDRALHKGKVTPEDREAALGAHTPEETAVSIAAEIVAVRWRGSGRRLAGTDGPIHHARGRFHIDRLNGERGVS